jgi:hypothetical protein
MWCGRYSPEAEQRMEPVIHIPYGWRWPVRLIALLNLIALSWFWWHSSSSGLLTLLRGGLALLFTFFVVVTGETVIDPKRREVRRGWKLLRMIPLSMRRLSFDEFQEIRWSANWVSPEVVTTHRVELVAMQGRPIALTTFKSHEPDRNCPAADQMTAKLVEVLAVPLVRVPTGPA